MVIIDENGSEYVVTLWRGKKVNLCAVYCKAWRDTSRKFTLLGIRLYTYDQAGKRTLLRLYNQHKYLP